MPYTHRSRGWGVRIFGRYIYVRYIYVTLLHVNKIRFNYKVEQGVQTVKPNKV